jgi:hypothetical protein
MKKKPNKAEREYLGKVADLGCLICFRPAEIHHVRAGMGLGERAEHIGGVLPLCPDHHRNGGYGVAIHAGRKTWEKANGTELELLQIVKAQVNI